MDELQLLREMRTDVPIVKDAVIDGGRERLLAVMAPGPGTRGAANNTARKGRRRKRVLRISLATVATMGLATALVATNVVGLAGWRGGATAEAAEVLNNAAETAIRSSDPVVGPGQYLKISSTNLWLSIAGATEEPGGHSQLEWLDTEKMSMYVPADRGQEWVWERSGRIPTTFFSDESKTYALNHTKKWGDTSELLREKGGYFYGSSAPFIDERELAAYSRDPRVLLNNIHLKTLGTGQSVDGAALGFIADLLRTGVIPADLRATLYKAAAMIPGVTVTENQATLDGQNGTAIGRDESVSGMRQEIIIDPQTGQLIGEREVLTEALGSIPIGTAVAWTTIHTSVVDAAP